MSPFFAKTFHVRRPSIGSIGAKIHPAKNLLLFFCSTQQKHYAARRFFSVVPILKFSPCGKRWRQNRQPPKNQHIQSSIGFCEQARQGPPFFAAAKGFWKFWQPWDEQKLFIYMYIWNKRHLPQAQLWLVCLENQASKVHDTWHNIPDTFTFESISHVTNKRPGGAFKIWGFECPNLILHSIL